MSVRQVEEVTRLLEAHHMPWNRAWNGGAALASAAVSMGHGLTITLLSPRGTDLSRFGKQWDRELARFSSKKPATTDRPSPDMSSAPGARIFVSSSSRDSKWSQSLKKHLMAILPEPSTLTLHDMSGIRAGDVWQDDLLAELSGAQVAVVLASPSALASRWVVDKELPALMKRADAGDLVLTWILLEPCPWEDTPLARFQALHDVTKPLSGLRKPARDRALVDIARAVHKLIADRRAKPSGSRPEGSANLASDVPTLAAAAFRADASIANGASIAFLAEFHDRALLVGGDAHADVLCDSIRNLLEQRGQSRLPIHAFVIPHGGSAGNLSRELLELLDCDRYLISSDGSKFKHPNRETIARIIIYGRTDGRTTLVFNYRTPYNEMWANPELQARYGYEAIYPPAGTNGIKVQI